MSRVGRKIIPVPSGVSVELADRVVKVKGPKGELNYRLLPGLEVEIGDGTVQVHQNSAEKNARAFWGLTRALINNMVVGVSEGYRKGLELVGTGYRAELKGSNLVLHLGYSHPIEYPIPKGVAAKIEGSKIFLESIDKQLIGQVAADVRSFRPPEPYKGKGVRFEGERVKHKAGKSAAGTGA
jgi:large subunit ribosomal protein L6